MYKVEILKQCGCVTRNGLTVVNSYTDREEARQEAIKLTKWMNEEFCHKHQFLVIEKPEGFVIIEDA